MDHFFSLWRHLDMREAQNCSQKTGAHAPEPEPAGSGLRPTKEDRKEESTDDGGDLGGDGLDAAPVQDGLTLLPRPEGVELPHDGVVEPELRVVGQVEGRLPLGNHRVLEGRVLVGEAAPADGVAVERLNLGYVGRVVREELADGFLCSRVTSLDEEPLEVVVGREGLEGDGQLLARVDDALARSEGVSRRADLGFDVVTGCHGVAGNDGCTGLVPERGSHKQRQENQQHFHFRFSNTNKF